MNNVVLLQLIYQNRNSILLSEHTMIEIYVLALNVFDIIRSGWTWVK